MLKGWDDRRVLHLLRDSRLPRIKTEHLRIDWTPLFQGLSRSEAKPGAVRIVREVNPWEGKAFLERVPKEQQFLRYG